MLNIIFRTVIIFSALLLLMRLLGKRQLGELELSELVVSILAADAASVPLQDPGLSIWHGLVPCAALFLCEFFVSWLTMKSVWARRILCGKPCFLVIGGVIQQKNMRQCRFTVDELAEELRKQGITDIAQAQYAVLETDGTLNVVPRPDARPVTCGLLGLCPEDDGYGIILIEDGALLSQNLKASGKDEKWLLRELRSRGVKSPKEVYALIVFESGKIFFSKKE